MSGWIKIHRSITNHWIYTEKRVFSKFEAWNDILLTVNYSESKAMIKGKIYHVKRGESILSLESWGKRWNWEKSKVRRFLNALQSDNMIVIVSDSITTRLTVCNYGIYQDERNTDETQMKRKRNTGETQTNLIKEDKEDKESNNPPNPPKGGTDEIEKFCSWFNNQLFIHTGNVGKFKTMTKTDISNLKRLKQGYSIDEWEHAFKMMIQSEWVQESKMATVAHFLRNDNFTKYVNQKTEQPKFRAAWE